MAWTPNYALIMLISVTLFFSVFCVVQVLNFAFANLTNKTVPSFLKLEDVNIPLKLEKYVSDTNNREMDYENLKKVADVTIPRLIKCLKDSPHIVNYDFTQLEKLPKDIESHYHDLLNKTKIFRDIYIHKHAYYFGPWIENYWINNFIDKPLSYFSGVVPLFIQWTDIHVHDFSDNKTAGTYTGPYIPEHQKMAELISPLLRSDVVYITVIQDDEGVRRKLTTLRPNLISISAGGFGHIAIPLIKGELKWMKPPKKFQYDVGFYGSHQRMSRGPMLNQLRIQSNKAGLVLKIEESPSWLQDMLDTKFNMAPRGFGRTSFRLVEIIQMGRLPVYIYDDIPWVPYRDSNLSVASFGFIARTKDMLELCSNIKKLTDAEYNNRMLQVQQARFYYTYPGVIKQLEMFFSDPLGAKGGNLVCSRVPNTEKRLRI